MGQSQHNKRFYSILTLFIFSFFLSSCGKKTAPQPIGAQDVLQPIQSIQAFYRGEKRLIIQWDVPKNRNSKVKKYFVYTKKIKLDCLNCTKIEMIISIKDNKIFNSKFVSTDLQIQNNTYQLTLFNYENDDLNEFYVQYNNNKNQKSPLSKGVRAINSISLPKPNIIFEALDDSTYNIKWTLPTSNHLYKIQLYYADELKPFIQVAAKNKFIKIAKIEKPIYARFVDQFTNQSLQSNILKIEF